MFKIKHVLSKPSNYDCDFSAGETIRLRASFDKTKLKQKIEYANSKKLDNVKQNNEKKSVS